MSTTTDGSHAEAHTDADWHRPDTFLPRAPVETPLDLETLHTVLVHAADQCVDLCEPHAGHSGWSSMSILMVRLRSILRTTQNMDKFLAKICQSYKGVDRDELAELFERMVETITDFDPDAMDSAVNAFIGVPTARKANGIVASEEPSLGDWPERVPAFCRKFLAHYNKAADLFSTFDNPWIENQRPSIDVMIGSGPMGKYL